MPLYIIREALPGAQYKDLVGEINLVIDFPGNLSQVKDKLLAKGLQSFAATPSPKPGRRRFGRKRGNPQKGRLRPNLKVPGKPSSRVLVLRALLDGPKPERAIIDAADYAGHSVVKLAINRNYSDDYLTLSDGVCTITTEGAAALRRFDEEFPALAASSSQQSQE